MSEEVHVQVKTKVLALDQLKEDLFENFRQWRPTRKRTREKLEELASQLQEQHIRGSKSTIVGASAGILLLILQEVTSREVIKASTDIFARIGFPEEIVSDNG